MKKIILCVLLVIILGAVFWWSSFRPRELTLKETAFSELPGWDKADTRKSFQAFLISCQSFLKQSPEKIIGSDVVQIKVQDWQTVCQAAHLVDKTSTQQTKAFFEQWFHPVQFYRGRPVEGLFTGYFMPALSGSLTKTAEYSVPLYGLPSDLISAHLHDFDPSLKHKKIVGRVNGKRLVPYYTRAQINKGAISNSTPIIAWIKSPIDRIFMEIQGSGTIELANGQQLFIGYAGENGAPYTPIAKVLINEGILTKDNASMERIKAYLESHPTEIDRVLNKNKSFVFFDKMSHEEAYGSQGVPLTPGYSLAVDQRWIPVGTPLWLVATHPDHAADQDRPFKRLMIAQDTGGAIRGPVRGDVYWGAGEKAKAIAGRMKNPGHYWLLLPRSMLPKQRE